MKSLREDEDDTRHPLSTGEREVGESVDAPRINALRKRKRALLLLLGVALHCLVLVNVFLLSEDMITGDHSAQGMVPTPLYGFMRVPDGTVAREHRAVDRLAADFAQVYFPSQRLTPEIYTRQSLDPWHRQSRYAPVVHAVCAATICRLEYGPASFLHMAIQLFLFLASLVYAFKRLHLGRYVWHGVTLANVCLFLTPVGLSWFERGQFSLYVSLGYLWLVLGILTGNKIHIVLSALFSVFKLSSFPFIFVVFVSTFLASRNKEELQQRVHQALVFAATVALLLLVYPRLDASFIRGLLEQELTFKPEGISLAGLLPKPLVKLLPLALIAVGYAYTRAYDKALPFLVPFFAGSAIILITYPTWAYDYQAPVLLCFIPLMLYWASLPEIGNDFNSSMIKYSFFTFLVAASFSNHIADVIHIKMVRTWLYVLGAAFFLIAPLLLIRRRDATAPEAGNE